MTVMQTPPLTDPEKVAMKAFYVAKNKSGGWPDLREIARALGQSHQRAFQLMESLVDKGRFVKVCRYRGYRPVRKAAKRESRRAA